MTPAQQFDAIAEAELGEEAGAWFCARVAEIAAGFTVTFKSASLQDVRQAEAMASAYALVLSDLRRKHAHCLESRVRYLDDRLEGRLGTAIGEIEEGARAAVYSANFARIKWPDGVSSQCKDATLADVCEALAAARGQALHELHVGRRSERDVPPDGNVALVVAALSRIGITEAVDTSRKRMVKVVRAAAQDVGYRRMRKFCQRTVS